MSWHIITNDENSGQPATRYLSGFSGSTSVLLFEKHTDESYGHAYLLLDSRYWEWESALMSADVRLRPLSIIRVSREYTTKQAIETIVERHSITSCVVDSTITSHARVISLKKYFSEIEARENIFEQWRTIKTVQEQEYIREAIRIAEEAFEKVKPYIRVGVAESEITARLEYEMKMRGAEKESFDTIVASGPHSASPHAVTTDRKIQSDDSVIIDFGCFYEGYASDLTKTILMPEAPPTMRKIYEIVQRAHDASVSAIAPGVQASSIDSIARNIITDAGYGEAFMHSTGHGVGMSVHESPHIGFSSKDVLASGHVITIEPGIYTSGLGGVRIETTEFVR